MVLRLVSNQLIARRLHDSGYLRLVNPLVWQARPQTCMDQTFLAAPPICRHLQGRGLEELGRAQLFIASSEGDLQALKLLSTRAVELLRILVGGRSPVSLRDVVVARVESCLLRRPAIPLHWNLRLRRARSQGDVVVETVVELLSVDCLASVDRVRDEQLRGVRLERKELAGGLQAM